MATHSATTGRLMRSASALLTTVNALYEDGRLDLAAYGAIGPPARRLARLATRADAERRAANGLLACGRIPRDAAVTLLDTADDEESPMHH